MRNIPFFSSKAIAIISWAGMFASLFWLIGEPRLLTLFTTLGWLAFATSTYNLRFLIKWLQERYQIGWSED